MRNRAKSAYQAANFSKQRGVMANDARGTGKARISSPIAAYRRVFENADILAQHGPVRILWKDGKKVE